MSSLSGADGAGGVGVPRPWQRLSVRLSLLFAAVTLGGLGAAYGALVGGFVIGLFVNVSTVWIPTELKNVGALGVLIVVLLVRPQGMFGLRVRERL